MHQAFQQTAPAACSAVRRRFATRRRIGTFRRLAGAGGIRSTTNDMLKFIAANLAKDDKPLTKAFQLVAPETPHDARWPGDRAGLAYCRDGITRWHNGMTGGYASWVAVVPSRDLGVVVLSNTAAPQITEIGDENHANRTTRPDRFARVRREQLLALHERGVRSLAAEQGCRWPRRARPNAPGSPARCTTCSRTACRWSRPARGRARVPARRAARGVGRGRRGDPASAHLALEELREVIGVLREDDATAGAPERPQPTLADVPASSRSPATPGCGHAGRPRCTSRRRCRRRRARPPTGWCRRG